MTILFSATTTPSCASTSTIPKLSTGKSLLSCRCPNPIGPFIVVDAECAFVRNKLSKLEPCGIATVSSFQQNQPMIVCMSPVVARTHVGGDSEISSDAEDDDGGGELSEQEAYGLLPEVSESEDDSIEIRIEKMGKNSRMIRSKVAVQANLQTVWDILTDYERLADFIPGLAVSQLLEKRENFARLFQIGEQNLAFGLKFNAKGTIDCFEKELQILPFGQKRDIEFKMIEGDFQLFEGKWSVEQGVDWDSEDLQSDSVVAQEFQTTLIYVVRVKPKAWLPVRLVEGRLCNEIRTNLSCIRDEAQKAFQSTQPAF